MRAPTIAVSSTAVATVFATVVGLATVFGATAARADVLVAPDTVRKERISATEVRITWHDPTDDEDGFEILRRPVTESEFESRGTVGPNVTEFVDDAVKDVVFIYQVRAFRDQELSDLSNECYVNRPGPATPIYFNARLIALHVARIGWSDRSNGEKGFEIQRAPLGSTNWQTIVRLPANIETYDDYSLHPATSYSYRMRAIGRSAICWPNSLWTKTRSLTTNGAVRILEVELRGQGKGKVTSVPAGISCSPTDDHCAAEFPIGEHVTITPKANRVSHFSGWSEYPICDDEDGPCEVWLNESKFVGATFRKNR